MCRFLTYSGPTTYINQLVLDACHSLVVQSKASKKTNLPVNGDGFGMAWYPILDKVIQTSDTNKIPLEPIVFKSPEPAWNNKNLHQLAHKIPLQHGFVHIRDATGGSSVHHDNCHPFQWQSYLWMHNGLLDDFTKVKRPLLSCLSERAFQFLQGETDSEIAFALFLDKINWQVNLTAEQIKQGLFDCMSHIMKIRQQHGATSNAFMNFAITNGEDTIVTRFSSLASVQPSSLFVTQGELFQQQGKLTIKPSATVQPNTSCVIASEPLTHDSRHWQKIDRNHFVHAKRNQIIELAPVPLPYQSDILQGVTKDH